MLKFICELRRWKGFFWFIIFMQTAMFYTLPAVQAAYGFEGAYNTVSPDLEKQAHVDMQGDSLTVRGQLRVLGNTFLNGAYTVYDTSLNAAHDTVREATAGAGISFVNHLRFPTAATIHSRLINGNDSFLVYMQGDKYVIYDTDNDLLFSLDASSNCAFVNALETFDFLATDLIKNYSGNVLTIDVNTAGPGLLILGNDVLDSIKIFPGAQFLIDTIPTQVVFSNTSIVVPGSTFFVTRASNDFLEWTGSTLKIKNNLNRGGLEFASANVYGNLNLSNGASSPVRDGSGVTNLIYLGDANDTAYAQWVFKTPRSRIDTNETEIIFKKAATFLEVDNDSSGASKTIDWGDGNKQRVFLNANCTFTFTAPKSPGNFTLVLVQNPVGSKIATWPASVKWPSDVTPTLTTTANAVDIIGFYYDGTNYNGQAGFDFR